MPRNNKKRGHHDPASSNAEASTSSRPSKMHHPLPPKPAFAPRRRTAGSKSSSSTTTAHIQPQSASLPPRPPHPHPHPHPLPPFPPTLQPHNWGGVGGYGGSPYHLQAPPPTASQSNVPQAGPALVFGDSTQPPATFSFPTPLPNNSPVSSGYLQIGLQATWVAAPHSGSGIGDSRDNEMTDLKRELMLKGIDLMAKDSQLKRLQLEVQQLKKDIQAKDTEIKMLRVRDAENENVWRIASPFYTLAAARADVAPAQFRKKGRYLRKKMNPNKDPEPKDCADGRCPCPPGLAERLEADDKPTKWANPAPCGTCDCCSEAMFVHTRENMPVNMPPVPPLDPWTVARVMTPRSSSRQREDSYEVLEWIGDRVLEMFAVLLVNGYGSMSPVACDRDRLRCYIVRNTTLSIFSRWYQLPPNLLKQSNPEDKVSVKNEIKTSGDLMEALIGGIFIDRGWDAALKFLDEMLTPAARWFEQEIVFGRMA